MLTGIKLWSDDRKYLLISFCTILPTLCYHIPGLMHSALRDAAGSCTLAEWDVLGQCSQSRWERGFQSTRMLLFMQLLPVGPQSFLYTSQRSLQTGALVFLRSWVSRTWLQGAGGAGAHLWGVLLSGLMLGATRSVRCWEPLCLLHIWRHCPVKLHCVKIIQVLSRYSSKAFKSRLI